MAGIYLHVPFCKQACHYCDFHFSTNLESRTALIQAMAKELHLQRSFLDNQPISTVYFGGGTPSLLTEDEFALLFSALRNNFTFTSNPEITLEANPDDLDEPKLALLKRIGINRLSIGVQSFHDTLLQTMNRAHNSASKGRIQQYQYRLDLRHTQ
jgi:oxygen-independent coproporphyrinogen III oxidase